MHFMIQRMCIKYVKNIKPIIRPRKDAKVYMSERNENISIIRLSENYKDGIANWKKKWCEVLR
ncbi:hypothetical protein Wcon_01221 [Wolbachia endosymbiont of Cylisticus convexus]|nr:hypothetical protein Wcon_01221 [Wolbachia endosymbiont of Cylisticus convexus]